MTKREETPWPRLLATVCMGFVLTVFSTTFFAWWSVGDIKLQPVVVMVVSAGFRLPLVAACAVAVILGYMNDLVGGGVLGLQVLAYLVVAIGCTVAQRKLEISSWPFQMMAAGVMTLVVQLTLIGGVMLVNRGQVVPLSLPFVLSAQALLSALSAPIFFGLLEGLTGILVRLWPSRGQAAG